MEKFLKFLEIKYIPDLIFILLFKVTWKCSS